MDSDWQIEDILDLEYFMARDAAEAEITASDPLRHRDRDLYLGRIAPRPDPAEQPDRRRALRIWLECRRARTPAGAADSPILPGRAYEEISRLLSWLLLATGICLGAGVALSLLDYRGIQPINVSVYLLTIVIPQIALLMLALLGGLLSAAGWRKARGTLLYPLLGRLLSWSMLRLRRTLQKRLSGSHLAAFQDVSGFIKGQKKVYGTLFFWPLFLMVQRFGIGFNLGVLGATLIKVTGTDIAFGWQSTLQVRPEVIHTIVSILAAPWAWMVPAGIAAPSPAEIAGSHMILKEGIYHLATRNLVSWWPFLCLAVLFYGLMPRLLLLIWGVTGRRRQLKRLRFDHAPCDRLYRRMTTPRISTQGRQAGDPQTPPPSPDTILDAGKPETGKTDSAPPPRADQADLYTLIPEELFENCAMGELNRVARRHFGVPVTHIYRLEVDAEAREDLFEKMGAPRPENGSPARYLVLQEAWQPPISENLALLRLLRRHVGGSVPIHVGLIGRPGAGTIFTAASDQDHQIWQRKLNTLGDPYLLLERMVTDDSPLHS